MSAIRRLRRPKAPLGWRWLRHGEPLRDTDSFTSIDSPNAVASGAWYRKPSRWLTIGNIRGCFGDRVNSRSGYLFARRVSRRRGAA